MIPSSADGMEKRQESRYRYAMEQPIRLERDAIDFAVIESDSYGLYEKFLGGYVMLCEGM